MNHLSRFKIVYVQILAAIASSIAGEFTGMKDLTPAQLKDLTWIVWTICACNIVVNTANVIIASFQPPPVPKQTNVS